MPRGRAAAIVHSTRSKDRIVFSLFVRRNRPAKPKPEQPVATASPPRQDPSKPGAEQDPQAEKTTPASWPASKRPREQILWTGGCCG